MATKLINGSKNGMKVLMLPFLAIGHISPFVELAKNLSNRGFIIHLCSTPVNLNFIKHKIPNKYLPSIQLLEFHLPEFPNFPPHFHTTNALPPHLNSTFERALLLAETAFSDAVETLRPDVFVYDVMIPWAARVAAAREVPALQFFTSSSAMCAYLTHLFHRPCLEFPFLDVSLTKHEQHRIRNLIRGKKDLGYVFDNNMMVISTSREIEGKYIAYLGEMEQYFEVLPLGTMVQDPFDNHQDGDDCELIKWLGMKSNSSTLFICFGSECILRKEVLEELAFGLELSRVNFVWVVKISMDGDGDEKYHQLAEVLPEGFLERVGERGRVVEGWVPQARILAHPSIGGFVSHCGWNSAMESIQYGVPIIAMPMHRFDQPVNAKLLADIGAGVEIVRDENGKFDREEIAKVIKDVMMGENFGEDMRRNVRNIGEKVRVTSVEEMSMAAKVLAKLCEKKNGQMCNK